MNNPGYGGEVRFKLDLAEADFVLLPRKGK
jgi:hypothetical protein